MITRLSRPRLTALCVVTVAILTLLLTGCSDKAKEPFKDAPRGSMNNSPADVGSMPDGFSNWAAKCDGPNRVYVIFHGDKKYGAIAVAPNDPRCK